MEKRLEEVLKEGGDYEHVAFLVNRLKDAWMIRAISPEGKVYYYYTWMESDEKEICLEVIDKTKKGKDGYPTPSKVESFISRMLKSGYRLDLGLHKAERYDLDETIIWKPLKDWYEDFLRFFEAVQGRPIPCHNYHEVHIALGLVKIPKDEWPDYWVLTIWEREELIERFRYFISHIWFSTLRVIYKVAKRMEKHYEWLAKGYPLQAVMKYMERRNPIKVIQQTLTLELRRYDKKQKDWLSSIIWQELLKAEKGNFSFTLDEIRINLGDEEEEE